MSRTIGTAVVAALFTLGITGAALAQEEQAPSPAPTNSASKASAPASKAEAPQPRQGRQITATLEVQVVFSRYLDEKKTGSLPYTFTVTAGGPRMGMRMGLETPIPSFNVLPDGTRKPAGYNYRSVGTNLDCEARDLGAGLYELNMTIENSSALGDKSNPAVAETGAPIFRTFKTTLSPVLRDRQSIQAVASTDPVTGEVVKIDLTLRVVK